MKMLNFKGSSTVSFFIISITLAGSFYHSHNPFRCSSSLEPDYRRFSQYNSLNKPILTAPHNIIDKLSKFPFIPSLVLSLSLLVLSPVTADDFSDFATTTAQSPIESIKATAEFVSEIQRTRPLNSDEFEIKFEESSLGLVLGETNYQGFPLVIVKEIKDQNLVISHSELRPGAIVVKIGDVSVDGLPLKLISPSLKQSRPITVRFRDPTRYPMQYFSFQRKCIIWII